MIRKHDHSLSIAERFGLDESIEPLPKPEPVFRGINAMAKACWDASKAAGWRDPGPTLPEMLINLMSEVTELWEAYRNNALYAPCDKAYKMRSHGIEPLTNQEEEAADIFIRLMDFAHDNKIDMDKAVRAKFAFNATRGHRHGGKAV